jgi:nucleotide sugar dehydrogenase
MLGKGNMPLRVSVIGNGFVGKATGELRGESVEVVAYDTDPAACDPPGTTLRDAARADVVFISVPTPMDAATGEVHLSIVESVVESVKALVGDMTFVVLRSTVPPGTCARLGVYFMPEFLTEANYLEDFRNAAVWIFGLTGGPHDGAFRRRMQELLAASQAQGSICSSRAVFVDSTEAEMVKYFRNTYLAAKVSFCNEIESLCGAMGISYENVRRVAGADARIGLSHTAVPGPDGRRGFGGTCFPKDCHGLEHEYGRHGVPCPVLGAVVQRNEQIDRVDRDWMARKGRSNI